MTKKKTWQRKKRNYLRSCKCQKKLYKEATERLSKAMQNKNFEDAQALYEAAQKRIKDTNERLQKCLKKREEISLIRRKVMDEYSQKFSTQTSKKYNCFVTCLHIMHCVLICLIVFFCLQVWKWTRLSLSLIYNLEVAFIYSLSCLQKMCIVS